MTNKVDFRNVSTIGLESSPVADALAGLRANEARYIMNKYKQEFVTQSAQEDPNTLHWIEKILEERNMKFPYKPLEVACLEVEGFKLAFVFYENGLAVNVLYSIEDDGKRAVGFKLAQGMDVPVEFEGKFKFAHQKSKLAGIVRGTFFVIKGSY